MIQLNQELSNPKILTEETELIKKHKSQQSQLSRCPHCNCRHIVRNGTYTRKTNRINEDEKTETIQVKIQKYKCKACNKAFNDIPIFLTNRKHFSLLAILIIVLLEESNRGISEKYDIARSTVRAYKKTSITDINRLKFVVKRERPESFEELVEKFKHLFSQNLFSLSTT